MLLMKLIIDIFNISLKQQLVIGSIYQLHDRRGCICECYTSQAAKAYACLRNLHMTVEFKSSLEVSAIFFFVLCKAVLQKYHSCLRRAGHWLD